MTQYYFETPSQNVGVALHVTALRMRGAGMSQKEWDKERGAIEQEVSRDNSNPGFKMSEQLLQQMFAGTPYDETPLGTRPSFDKTTAAALKQFHDAWYAPNNAILVVAGDVDPATTLAAIKRDFAGIPAKTLPARPKFDFQPVQDLKQMQDAPVNATELQQAKGILLRRIPLGESSFGAIADNLLTYSMEGKPLDESTLAAQHYLALTADEVQQVFAKHVRPDGLVTSAKGPVPK